MGFLHEHIILPISDLITGEHVHRYLRMMRQADDWSDFKLNNFQMEQLRKLVTFAAKEVPYYRDWFKQSGMKPQELDSLNALTKLPIVDKALMRSEGIDRFASESFPKGQRLYSRSSGSTGEPFSYYESKLSHSVNAAAKLHTWYQAGYRMGNPYMKIAHGARHGKMKKLQDCINRCDYVPLYSIDDGTLKGILDRIEKIKPSFIRVYPTPLYHLALYRKNHPEYQFKPCHIMTTGSTLPDPYRKMIEHVFGCDVIDSYSCEGTPNVYETPAHDGYHVTQYYGIIEVLDSHDAPVLNGVGRVVSTDLWNFAHPFLRYDTQDLVEVRDGRIVQIMGRECETLEDANGGRYTIHNFVGFFQEEDRPIKQSVDAYQVVKRKDGSVNFRLVVNSQYNTEIEQYIIRYWQEKLNVPVHVEVVTEIPLMDNNKRRTIIHETAE